MSIDYELFITEMKAEFDRLKDVYEGRKDDIEPNIMTMEDNPHLRYIGTSETSELTRFAYMNAYDHMRAMFRAAVVTSMSRYDFYQRAVEDMDKQISLYSKKLRYFKDLLVLLKDLSENNHKDKITKSEGLALSRKPQIEINLREAMSIPDDVEITPRMISEYHKKKREAII